MKIKTLPLLILALIFINIQFINANEPLKTEGTTREKPPVNSNKLPTISLGVGNLSFFGDISNNVKLFPYTNFKLSYNLKVEERFLSCFGASLNVLYGKMEENEKILTRVPLNFQSKIMQGDLNLIFYFDNNFLINRASRFAPYIYGGIGYMSFDPKADLLAKDGSPYFYWSDGTIRNQAQSEQTLGTSKIINRDYVYETSLNKSYVDSSTYKKTTMTIPFGGGIRFKLSDKFNGNISATYYMTQTDFLDNFKSGKKNDNFLYTSVSFGYNIGVKKIPKEPTIFDGVDFKSGDNEDDDGDGVKNIEDACAGTQKGVQVNSHGCPLDGDGDGIPDYLDKEPNTAKGALVNENGETITDESAEKKAGDTTAISRDILYTAYPSQKLAPIPGQVSTHSVNTSADLGEFKIADTNNDGRISSDEISNAIDAFFDGDKRFSPALITKMIDFFFEQ